jgi:hypothetical protein
VSVEAGAQATRAEERVGAAGTRALEAVAEMSSRASGAVVSVEAGAQASLAAASDALRPPRRMSAAALAAKDGRVRS